MNKVIIHRQEWGSIAHMNSFSTRGRDVNLPRTKAFEYHTNLYNEAACEQAFHITNAPDECLTPEQFNMRKGFTGPSVSVGDMIEIVSDEGSTDRYICDHIGWVHVSRNLYPNLAIEHENV